MSTRNLQILSIEHTEDGVNVFVRGGTVWLPREIIPADLSKDKYFLEETTKIVTGRGGVFKASYRFVPKT